MLNTVCAIISIAYMTVMVAHTVVSLVRAGRRERCEQILKYKKGKFAAMYIAGLPLYFAAFIDAGIVLGFINAINATIRMAVLSFDFAALLPIMEKNVLFGISAALCIIVTYLNTMLLTLSVLFRSITNKARLRRIRMGERNLLVLVGSEKKNSMILSSMRREQNDKAPSRESIDVLIISEKTDDALRDDAYVNYAAYLPLPADLDLGGLIKKEAAGFDKRHVRVIISTGNDETDLALSYNIARLADELGESLLTLTESGSRSAGLDAHVLTDGDPRLYTEAARISHGSLRICDETETVSESFILDHPVTSVISPSVNTELAVLKDGTQLRVFFIGDGAVLDKISDLTVQNSQMLEEYIENGKATLKEADVRYFRLFANRSEDSFYEYHNFTKEKALGGEYLELPEAPEINAPDVNIYSKELRPALGENLTAEGGGYNMIIISAPCDMDAVRLTTDTLGIVSEYAAEANTTVFVRLRSQALASEIKGIGSRGMTVNVFGTDSSIYNYSSATSEGIEALAMARHVAYSAENAGEGADINEVKKKAVSDWLFDWAPIQRNSNLYATLSIRSRLNMLGYDMVKGEGEDASESFVADYFAGNSPRYMPDGVRIDYSDLSYRKENTARTNIAIAEHMRWNVYYMQNGFVPASLGEYSSYTKAELYRRRKHANITTFRGLYDYENVIMEKRGIERRDADVIKYDYQLMDYAVSTLRAGGYRIVKL